MIRVIRFTILGALVLALGLGPIGCGGETSNTSKGPDAAQHAKKEEGMKKVMEEKQKGAAGAASGNGSGAFIVGGGAGGAIDNLFFSPSPVTMTVSNCKFTNNQAIGGTGNIGAAFVSDGIGGGFRSSATRLSAVKWQTALVRMDLAAASPISSGRP